jgi:adenosylhomocysteine nucleosidase
MESEAVHLRNRLTEQHEAQLAVWRRTRGRLDGVPVELLVCGIGLVSAAAATGALLSATAVKPRAVINYGCAGAHRDDIALGDVVIGTRTAYVTSMIILPDGSERHQIFAHGARDYADGAALPSDPQLLMLAIQAASELVLPAWPGAARPPRVYQGTIASCDLWTQHVERIRAMHGLHGSLCDEMEAAAIAQVCATFGVPFLPLKDISDNQLVAATPLTEHGTISLDHIRDDLGRRAALLAQVVIRRLEG